MNLKELAAKKAITYVKEGMIVGLGTGSTAWYFVEEVGKLVSQGMKLQAVATSLATEKHALSLNIPLLAIEEVDHIDLDVDGADEVDHSLNAIKGGGGALFREKIVASIAKEVIFIVDEKKVVNKIGKFPLPVEIIPYGYNHIIQSLKAFNPVLRMNNDKPYITDNGHYIIDLHLGEGFDINEVDATLQKTVGVLETGLFINLCKRLIIGTNNGVEIFEKVLH